MFINLSNHPSSCWSSEQLAAATAYGDVTDIPFPNISTSATDAEISSLADDYASRIISQGSPVVHIMGEMTFTYALVKRLRQAGITCLASTTQRIKQQLPDGSFISEFRFQSFRNYE